jgi:fructan beta-fructosidase
VPAEEPKFAQTPHPDLFKEKHRPQLHFSSPTNWLNDPNGLVWHEGVFHLFYQYNPTGNTWGNMHWGHAVSRNLFDWEVRPVALRAEPWGIGFMFSGCAVVDRNNSSGLAQPGETPLVALYTNCTTEGIQAQSLAYSVDDGESWIQYEGNPVIANPGVRDFRDPKVFWHAPTAHWVMTLAVKDHVEFYSSKDLREWQLSSRFARPHGVNEGVWECPDLFALRAPSGELKWVLVVSVSPEHSSRDETIRYFIGEFDGTRFEPEHLRELWLDHGADNYAAVTWDGMPAEDGRRIIIGWMNSWRYAREAPTYPWAGHMTLPRELKLVDGPDGLELAAAPAREIEHLRLQTFDISVPLVGSPKHENVFASLSPELLDIEMQFAWNRGSARAFGVRFENQVGEQALVLVDVEANLLVVDRTTVGQRVPNPKFAGRFTAPLRPLDELLDIRIIKDRASIEIFADEGRAVISANLFFDVPFDRVVLIREGDVEIHGQVSVLRSIWSND